MTTYSLQHKLKYVFPLTRTDSLNTDYKQYISKCTKEEDNNICEKNTDYLVLGTLSLLTGDCPTPKNILRLDCHVRSFKNMVYTNAPYKSKEYPEY